MVLDNKKGNVLPLYKEHFLGKISSKVDDQVFDHLLLSGFDNPINKLDIDDLKKLIKGNNLPDQSNLKEYCWCIHESGIEQVCSINNNYLKAYIISIMLYSHRRTNCIDALDEVFYYLFVVSCFSFSTDINKQALGFLFFIKNKVEFPDKYPPNNDFFLSLSILVLSSSLEKKNDDIECLIKEWNYKYGLDSIYSDFIERWSSILDKTLDEEVSYAVLDIFTDDSPNQMHMEPVLFPS